MKRWLLILLFYVLCPLIGVAGDTTQDTTEGEQTESKSESKLEESNEFKNSDETKGKDTCTVDAVSMATIDSIVNINVTDVTKRFTGIWVWLFVITALLIVMLLRYLEDGKKRSERLLSTLKDGNLHVNVDLINERLESLYKETGELKKLVVSLEKKAESSTQRAVVQESQPEIKRTANKPKVLFAKSIIQDVFMSVKEEQAADSVFELTLKPDGTTASVSICKSAYPKILANQAYLDGCDSHINGNGRSEVVVKEEGLAEKTGDNKWVVRKKINVIVQ